MIQSEDSKLTQCHNNRVPLNPKMLKDAIDTPINLFVLRKDRVVMKDENSTLTQVPFDVFGEK